ncbi:MAG TPA: recombinase family protein [Rhodospirillaceae bacterium]|nr:recombinase family protein [Rhodospirillaceae bacterium]
MYVRMSTDHQKYSTENQADAIREYALHRQIEIVKTYTDSGKSGLKLDGRDALQSLIADVQAETFDYGVILVLDVTRWGRFQDADESAYYEYICRRAGIDVQYVAEQFENDGSPVSTIVKGVKRAMAGEYSRELSCKVFAGQCRLIELGFRQGGPAGYGLRRVLVDEQRQTKGELKRGEQKSLQTDRVVLVPGPKEEVENVRWVYRAFTEEGLQESEIAAKLNKRGVSTDLGRPWTRGTVHELLINEKYIGNNVFNRKSFKLKKRRVTNTPDMWVRSEGAFDAIVEARFFYTAQGIIRARSRRFSNDDMLTKLKALQERKGWLSGILINEAEDMPSSSAYAHRFGGLVSAYKLIGYDPGIDYSYQEINKHLRSLFPEISEGVIKGIKEAGGSATHDFKTPLIIVNDEIALSIVIARCQRTETGSLRWKIRLDTGFQPDFTIAVRMNPENKAQMDYYILPAIDIENPKLRLAEDNGFALDTYRFDSLDPFFQLAARVALSEAA